MRLKIHFILFIIIASFGCGKKQSLKTITVDEFSKFVDSTGYVTDAEKYGWSIVQKTIHEFEIVDNATWKIPNGIDPASPHMAVTQVSYNDAIAFCKWSGTALPSYDDYWKMTQKDNRKVIMNANQIESPENINIIGNTWDITNTINYKGEVRLAGGSYLCSKSSCDGTNPDRKLYVSLDTGNSHISFSIIQNEQ